MTDHQLHSELLTKPCYDTGDLRRIVEILRSPGGCPWDAAQTNESIRNNFIEETYEAIEAINCNDDALLCEELGDVLLQVALHVQIAQERGAFTWEDVTNGICRKLLERHPHVFGEAKAESQEEALSNWEAIKRQSKDQKSTAQSIESIPRELPALMRAQKIQEKAAKAGFDWREDTPLQRLELDLLGEADELREALQSGSLQEAQAELGDVLFSAVNIARVLHGCDAEEALTGAIDRFAARFAIVEQLAHDENIDMKTTSVEELDRLWAMAKARLKENA